MSEKITDLVKKLLRLARDKAATPAEAASALNRALELIEKHRIDVDSLDLDADTERLVCERIHIGARVSFLRKGVARVLQSYFRVRICWERCSWEGVNLALVGFAQDVTIATYVFDFLVGSCSRAQVEYIRAEKKARRVVNAKKKDAFVQGWLYGVASQLIDPQPKAIGDSKTALVLAARQRQIDDYFDEVFPTATTPKAKKTPTHNAALMQGWRAGKATQILTPLGSSQGQLSLE